MSQRPAAPPVDTDDDTEVYLQEACYYLRKKGLTLAEVSKALEVSEKAAERFYSEFESKLASGLAQENEVDRNLWEDMYKRYLNTKVPVGYDPMALQRQVKRAMELIEVILEEKWRQEPKKG